MRKLLRRKGERHEVVATDASQAQSPKYTCTPSKVLAVATEARINPITLLITLAPDSPTWRRKLLEMRRIVWITAGSVSGI